MFGVKLQGHDYKYEVAELLKLFTTQFKFINSNDEFEKILINEVIIKDKQIESITKFYENKELKICKSESFDTNLTNKEDIKKGTKTIIKRSIFNVLDELFKTYVPWGILTGIRPVKIVHN